MQRTLAVHHYDVLDVEARRDHYPGDRYVGRACPYHGDLGLADLLTHELVSVDSSRGLDGGGALLVVMPYRYVHLRSETVQDLKALRVLDILEVDPSEGGGQVFDGLDDLLGVLRVQAYGDGVHASQVLEEQGLPFHHRQAGLGPYVPQTEDPGAIGDDRHHVALGGVVVHSLGVGLDVLAWLGDAGSVPDGEILKALDRALGGYLDLALVEGVVFHCQPGRLVRFL